MAKTSNAVAGTSYKALGAIDHNGVRYAPGTALDAIPAEELSEVQLGELIAAGAVDPEGRGDTSGSVEA